MASTQTTSPTIRLRKSADRGFEDFGWTDSWMTFSFGEYRDPAWMNFGPLRVIVENHIQPRKGFPSHSHRDVEIVTYAGLFRPGDRAPHDLEAGRGLWAQVVHGQLEVAGVALEEGDGVGITNASRLDFDFGADSEVVLFDVRMDPPVIR